jgi:hypothetical protein
VPPAVVAPVALVLALVVLAEVLGVPVAVAPAVPVAAPLEGPDEPPAPEAPREPAGNAVSSPVHAVPMQETIKNKVLAARFKRIIVLARLRWPARRESVHDCNHLGGGGIWSKSHEGVWLPSFSG